jgi:hypothetical protein
MSAWLPQSLSRFFEGEGSQRWSATSSDTAQRISPLVAVVAVVSRRRRWPAAPAATEVQLTGAGLEFIRIPVRDEPAGQREVRPRPCAATGRDRETRSSCLRYPAAGQSASRASMCAPASRVNSASAAFPLSAVANDGRPITPLDV